MSKGPRRAGAQLSAQEKDLWVRTLRAVAPLTDAEAAEGLALVRPRTLERGEHFLSAGARATELAVVARGLLREYFVLPRGVERAKAFAMEGELTGSLADLLSGEPSRAYITAEEPCVLLVSPFEAQRALAARWPAWAELSRRATERLLLRKAEREYELLGLDAEARYEALRARWPDLESRVAAQHVASYLGITPVHLSRLRRRRRERRGRAPRGAP